MKAVPERTSLVYVVTNSANGKRYVGQTHLTLAARWKAHVTAARGPHAFCRLLYAAIRKYGHEAFSIQAVEVMPPGSTQADLDAAEQRQIAAIGTLSPHGYNLLAARGGRGIASDSTRARMSVAKKGRKHTPEHAAKIGAANRGRKANPAAIAKMNAARLALGRSAETRAKISAANKGRPQHPNQIAALRAAHVGAKRSPETCARISAAKRAAHARRISLQESTIA